MLGNEESKNAQYQRGSLWDEMIPLKVPHPGSISSYYAIRKGICVENKTLELFRDQHKSPCKILGSFLSGESWVDCTVIMPTSADLTI